MSDLGPAASSTRRRNAKDANKAKPYSNGKPDPSQELLHALQAMRSGDFSVRMTGDHLDAILKLAGAKNEKDGWVTIVDGGTMSLHIAHDGASMTVSRIEALRQDGELVYARNPKREVFVIMRSDVFAVALEAESVPGKVARRAGFG